MNTKENQVKLQKDINTLAEWADRWQMAFNASKCKVMHIGRTNVKTDYSMGDTVLAKCSSEKDLGVNLSDTLKAEKQCAEAAKKGNRVLSLIKCNFKFFTKDIIIRLHKQMVRPHLEYAIQAWSPYLQKDIDKLEKVQRRATKMIKDLEHLDYNSRLEQLGLTTLK